MTQASDLRRHKLIFGEILEQAQNKPEKIDPEEFRPSITISRTTGARAVTIARKLADRLGRDNPDAHPGWTLYDKNLVHTIIKRHRLPIEVMRYMPEDKMGIIRNYVEGLMVGSSDKQLFGATVETIRKLGYLGHTIVVGRGGNIINRELPNCYHIRLIGSMPRRLEHVMDFYDLTNEEAVEKIASQDRGRERFVKTHFHESVDDPAHYHLIINTDQFSDDDVVEMVSSSLGRWANKQRETFDPRQTVDGPNADQ